MKKFIKFSLELLCLGLLFFFTSCENFLEGNQTKSEIEAHIAYANASTYMITVDTSGMSGIVKAPAGGEINKKVSDVFNLRFDTFPDYEFLYWKIIDSNTKYTYQNGEYLEVAELTESETTCTFVKTPDPGMQLCLVPVVAERPQILSYTPILTEDLSVRDTTIQVIFDHDMSDESIYYTSSELRQIMSELGIKDEDDPALLHAYVNDTWRFYGYKKNGHVYFKNISITNNMTGENLNDCFTKPSFETKRILVIYADINNLPPGFEQIQINLDKNFFYYGQNRKKITMSGSKKWIYGVNNRTDTSAPEIMVCDVEIAKGEYTGNKMSAINEYGTIDTNNLTSSDVNVLTAENIVNINLRAKDTGCGLQSSFNVSLTQISDNNFVLYENTYPRINTYNFDHVTMYDARFEHSIDLGGMDDGLYKLTVEVKDRNEKSDKRTFLVAKDTTAPDDDDFVFAPHYNGNNNATIYFKTNKDIRTVKFYDQDLELISSIPISLAKGKCDISLEQNQDHIFYVILVDIGGNESELYSRQVKPGHLQKDFTYVPGENYPNMLVCDHEVTQSEYKEYMTFVGDIDANDPGYSSSYAGYKPKDGSAGDNYPAYYVSWFDTLVYCNLRSILDGLTPVYVIEDKTNPTQWSMSKKYNEKYYAHPTDDVN